MIGDSITDCERARPVGEGLFGALAWDRVHPNLTGHAILARAFLKAVGCPC